MVLWSSAGFATPVQPKGSGFAQIKSHLLAAVVKPRGRCCVTAALGRKVLHLLRDLWPV